MTTPTTAEQIDALVQDMCAAIQSLSTRVKTRDVGRCQRCEGYTSSGMDAYCRECALHVLRDGTDALVTARATIARLEGELEVERMCLAACAVAAWGGEVRDTLSPYDSDSLRAVVALRTRADAAERRVEAVTGDAAVEAAARALCDGFRVVHIDGEDYPWFDNCTEEGKNVWRGLAKLTIAGALAAASGDTATTEG